MPSSPSQASSGINLIKGKLSPQNLYSPLPPSFPHGFLCFCFLHKSYNQDTRRTIHGQTVNPNSPHMIIKISLAIHSIWDSSDFLVHRSARKVFMGKQHPPPLPPPLSPVQKGNSLSTSEPCQCICGSWKLPPVSQPYGCLHTTGHTFGIQATTTTGREVSCENCLVVVSCWMHNDIIVVLRMCILDWTNHQFLWGKMVHRDVCIIGMVVLPTMLLSPSSGTG